MEEKKAVDPKLADALKSIYSSLTDEQREKAKACKTFDELAALAAKEGVELPDELLDAVAGGYILPEYDETYGEVYYLINDETVTPEGKYYVKDWVISAAKKEGYSTEFITHERYHQLQNSKRRC